jgi:hypothetical protein
VGFNLRGSYQVIIGDLVKRLLEIERCGFDRGAVWRRQRRRFVGRHHAGRAVPSVEPSLARGDPALLPCLVANGDHAGLLASCSGVIFAALSFPRATAAGFFSFSAHADRIIPLCLDFFLDF